MDQLLVCKNVSHWLNPGGGFFPFAFDAYRVEGPGQVFFDQEFEKWRAFRDRRLIDAYDYAGALRQSAVFAFVIPYHQTLERNVPSPAAAGLVSTFSYARDYARTTGDADRYFQNLGKALAENSETITFVVPIVGALGIKG
jgi:hypothetical protein